MMINGTPLPFMNWKFRCKFLEMVVGQGNWQLRANVVPAALPVAPPPVAAPAPVTAPVSVSPPAPVSPSKNDDDSEPKDSNEPTA